MIVRWTLKELLRARARVFGSIAAVGAAFALVMVFRAVWEGESRQIAVYLERAGADVWVMQDNVSNMHMASSFIAEGKRNEVSRVDGVRSVDGILYLNTLIRMGPRLWFSYVVGLDEPGRPGGPWSLSSGRGDIRSGEAVVPNTLARLTDVHIGDSIRVADRSFAVVGLSNETFSVINPVVFVPASDLAELLSLRGYDSYMLVRADMDVQPGTLATRIEEEVDGVAALTTPELISSDLQLASQMGTEIIALMTAISSALATLLVAFALFLHVSHTRRQLVILKAVGFSNRHLYASVLIQAGVITSLAFIFAVGAAGAIAVVGPRLAPILSLTLSPDSVLSIGLAGLIVAVAATLILARKVAGVDPMSAFSE